MEKLGIQEFYQQSHHLYWLLLEAKDSSKPGIRFHIKKRVVRSDHVFFPCIDLQTQQNIPFLFIFILLFHCIITSPSMDLLLCSSSQNGDDHEFHGKRLAIV